MNKDKNIKVIGEYENDKVSMIFVECNGCGYHLGVDNTYLDQVDAVTTECPSCGLRLVISDAE